MEVSIYEERKKYNISTIPFLEQLKQSNLMLASQEPLHLVLEQEEDALQVPENVKKYRGRNIES